MSEFNNRIEAQRAVLQVVNRKRWPAEELFGLSSKAIDRWVSVNRIDPRSKVTDLLKTVSSKLFFLANKSQEQVSEDYRITSAEIATLTAAIDRELA